MNILYKTAATSTGGRDGRATSHDQKLDVKLSAPRELGGAGAEGTNPEQLFAAGYSACFLSAMKFVAGQNKQTLPADTTVTAEVGIGPNEEGDLRSMSSCASRFPGSTRRPRRRSSIARITYARTRMRRATTSRCASSSRNGGTPAPTTKRARRPKPARPFFNLATLCV